MTHLCRGFRKAPMLTSWLSILSCLIFPVAVVDAGVPVCHQGRTVNVARSSLWRHRSHGDKLGGCGGPQQVTICHYPGEQSKTTLRLSQDEAYKHMINHPKDFLGSCTTSPKTEPPETPDDDEFKGRDFRISGDVNDPRLLRAVLEDEDTSEDHVVAWYGQYEDFEFNIKSVDAVTLFVDGDIDDVYMVKTDPFDDRATRFTNTPYKFDMSILYRDTYDPSDPGTASFFIEFEGISYSTDVDLFDIVGRRRQRERERRAEERTNKERHLQQLRGADSKDGSKAIDDEGQRNLATAISQVMRRVLVSFVDCDGSAMNENSAIPFLDYSVEDDRGSLLRSGTVLGHLYDDPENDYDERDGGIFEFYVPIASTVDNYDDIQAACGTSVEAIETTCDVWDNTLAIRDERERNDICDRIVDNLDLDNTEEGDAIRGACYMSFERAYQSCSILESRSGNSIDIYEICDAMDVESSYEGETWELTTRIVYPFESANDAVVTIGGTIPMDREVYTDFLDDEGPIYVRWLPTIVSVSTSPRRVESPDGYTIRAVVACVDVARNNDVVELSYVGSDQFKGITKCDVPDSKTPYTCELHVGDGAPSGTRDTARVTIISPGTGTLEKSLTVEHY